MKDEWVYEVDEDDRVVGQRTRADVHRLGLRHRAVHILVFNHLDQLLLQKRSPAKDINPELWDTSAAGHVDWGESYDECALRELGEELGIVSPSPPRFLFKLPASAETGWEFIQVYRVVHSGTLRLDPREIDECRWFDTNELDSWVHDSGIGLTPSFKLIWLSYRNRRP